MKNIFYVIVLMLFFTISCKDETKKVKDVSSLETKKELNVIGNYVSEEYSKRSEGYDWIAILVTEAEGNQLNISVRSRADKKKPTCTFDAVANKADDKVYQTQIDGKSIWV